MAMILIETKEIEENGEVYIVETNRSDKTGRESMVKYLKSSKESEPTETDLTPAEQQEARETYIMAML